MTMNTSPENEIRAALLTAERLLDRCRMLSRFVPMNDKSEFVKHCYKAGGIIADAYQELLPQGWKE